jgi:hypothetical protein
LCEAHNIAAQMVRCQILRKSKGFGASVGELVQLGTPRAMQGAEKSDEKSGQAIRPVATAGSLPLQQ